LLGVTAEALLAKVDCKIGVFEGRGQFRSKFQVQ